MVNENESVPEDETFPDSEKTERLIHFPITRIKNIIKLDPDVTLASRDAVVMIAKAAVNCCFRCNRHIIAQLTDGHLQFTGAPLLSCLL